MSNEQHSIGMMEGAFFVPKSDLLNWINSSLKLDLTKIEQLGTGAVYCQIIDMMFPGRVNLAKVNWKAKNQWQFINNLKILQQSFAKCKIHKYIDIQKLSKSKYQDNLQFIQWLKRYYDLYNKSNAAQYDPLVARKNIDTDFSFVQIRSHPLKREKENAKNRIKSRSPYDKIKPKVNNRSVTLQRYPHQNAEFYLGKLSQIKEIMSKGSKQGDKLKRINEIMQEIKEELPNPQTIDFEQSEVRRLETVPSKKAISQNRSPIHGRREARKQSIDRPGNQKSTPAEKKEKKGK